MTIHSEPCNKDPSYGTLIRYDIEFPDISYILQYLKFIGNCGAGKRTYLFSPASPRMGEILITQGK